jgi:hypothetical protein
MELHRGKRVQHWKEWWRTGEVIQWYAKGRKAKKMWIFFDDGEVELRWITAFVAEEERVWITPIKADDKKTIDQVYPIPKSQYVSHNAEHAEQKLIKDGSEAKTDITPASRRELEHLSCEHNIMVNISAVDSQQWTRTQ